MDGPRPQLYIPIPDASREVANYDQLYKPNYARPTRLIRYVGGMCTPLYAARARRDSPCRLTSYTDRSPV